MLYLAQEAEEINFGMVSKAQAEALFYKDLLLIQQLLLLLVLICRGTATDSVTIYIGYPPPPPLPPLPPPPPPQPPYPPYPPPILNQ